MNGDPEFRPGLSPGGGRTVTASGKPTCQRLLERIRVLGLPYGREDSFKIGSGRMRQNRILIGVECSKLPPDTFFEIAFELGMPPECHPLLIRHLPEANTFFFGLEEGTEGSVCKVYLEFWDKVCGKVRATGTREPQLLHLGVKWDSLARGRYEVARYTCFPLLNSPDVLRRMAEIYPPGGPRAGVDGALRIVRAGVRRKPYAPLLYLEASESGNPRRSFDVNLYKTGLLVQDVACELRAVALDFGIGEELFEAQLQKVHNRPLGHLSGGIDRNGGEFLSVYAEISPP